MSGITPTPFDLVGREACKTLADNGYGIVDLRRLSGKFPGELRLRSTRPMADEAHGLSIDDLLGEGEDA